MDTAGLSLRDAQPHSSDTLRVPLAQWRAHSLAVLGARMHRGEGAVTPEACAAIEADMPRRQPVQPRVREFLRIKVISMGEGNSGKSCLIKRYCEQRFVIKYVSTIGVDFGVKTIRMADGIDVKVNFWDLSGQPEFLDVRNEFYRDAQGALLVYDVSCRRTFDALDAWLKEARKYGATDAHLVLCANKIDCKKRVITEADGKAYAASKNIAYFETSANSGANVNEAFEHIFTSVVASIRGSVPK